MKKINSEICVDLPYLKTKWGTVDKKNPTSIYLEVGTYITPKNDGGDYRQQIKEISKTGKEIIKKAIIETNEIKNDFIFVTDVADARISYGKKSYISFQIHMGRTNRDIASKRSFKEIVGKINNEWTNVYDGILAAIENNGFDYSKRKK